MTSETADVSEADLRERFLSVMAGVATPVTVVTSLVDDAPYGTTVSAFASLSLNPPMVLVALDRDSDLLAVVRRTGRFGVNVLGALQSALALTFARKGGTGKFEGTPCDIDNGLPRLPDAPGWLACDVETLVEGGDHLVVLGNVVAAEARQDTPLTYHSRAFGTHVALEADS